MSKIFLVIENACWADEFNVEGFRLMKAESTADVKKQILEEVFDGEEPSYPHEAGFGTNEGIEVSSEKELWQNIKIKEITEEEAKVLTKLFGKDVYSYSFGLTAFI